MKNIVEKFLHCDKNEQITINIVGDVILDEYYYVDADRISPEFPIPVMLSPNTTPTYCLPGGAANVALQLRDYNVKTKLYGLIDDYAEQVLNSNGISTEFCVKLPSGCHVPVKKRLYSKVSESPLFRWDIESPYYGDQHLAATCVETLIENFKKHSYDELAILSDYNKGVFNWAGDVPWVKFCKAIVDPKKGPLKRWSGCYVFKPNFKEASELTGLTSPVSQCEEIQKTLNCEGVIVTMAGDGVFGRDKENVFVYKTPQSVVADSVIGAGDCFIAFLAMTLARGFSLVDAAKLAYETGVIYVHRRHNKPVEKYDLVRKFMFQSHKFASIVQIKQTPGKKVFTNGCFDIIHPGHINTLNFAKSCGDLLIVALNDNASVQRLKGVGRPILDLESRMQVISALEMVDFVVSFSEDTPKNIIEAIQPDVLVKGSDYVPEDIVGSDIVKDVRVAPLVPGISTTDIIERIK